jgi:hypothetical protein
VTRCVNPVTHAECEHLGWQQTALRAIDLQALDAARIAASYASRDLSLDTISVKFFEPGPILNFSPSDPNLDRALVQLNGGEFDPSMRGKACIKAGPLPIVWVRSGLSPCLTAAVVLHEARHIWHDYNPDPPMPNDEECDCESYMWKAVLRAGFEPADVALAFEEATS